MLPKWFVCGLLACAAAPGQVLVFTQLRGHTWDGARIVARAPGGRLRILTGEFQSAADPDVSFDGTRLLFAARKTAADPWDIYEMNADGTGARRITRGLGDCRTPVYQGALFYLNDERPAYQVAFAATAGGESNLYSIRRDGTGLRRLTYTLSDNFDPFQMADGRLVFASRYSPSRLTLFAVHIDGTDYTGFAGPQGRTIQRMPCTTPNRLAIFVEADRRLWDGAGTLASVSLRRPMHSYRALTAEADGLFAWPSPLPDGAVLVSARPANGAGTHAIYRLDPDTGRRELVFDDPACHDIQAKLLAPRAEPEGHSSVVDETEPTAKFYCLSIYDSDIRMPRVKRMRAIEGLAGKERRLLGEFDIDEDGSFQIRVPANTPIRLQALDAAGKAIRETPWIWAKNKENRGCIGCHEDRERTPQNVLAKALTHPAVQLVHKGAAK